MLSTTTIDQVRDLPIEQVIGNYVQLKRAGSSYKACCPLHDEKSPSFVVTPAKNIFKCFGCGRGGDSITFVMEKENIPFIDAVKKIASDHGIHIEEKEDTITPEQRKEKDVMMQLLRQAQDKYRDVFVRGDALVESDGSGSGPFIPIQYLLNKRGLTHETIIEWQFGFCNDWKVISTEVINSGSFSVAEKVGLVKRSNSNTYDFYHHRITIPIRNRNGEIIGFGGRICGSYTGAKYLNGVDSPVYDKSSVLFGLDKAIRNFKAHGMAILVEGYFDVIKLHQRGWNNAVASCGTALTIEQAKQLKRFTETVLVLRDGDKAGVKAMEKDIPVLTEAQLEVLVCTLPPGEDPDTLFDNPFERITSVLWNTVDGIEYLCGQYLSEATSAAAIASGLEKVVALLALIKSPIRRNEYIKIIAAANKGKIKAADIAKPIDQLFKDQERERAEAEMQQRENRDSLPVWVDRNRFNSDGFAQLPLATSGYQVGIYFRGDGESIFRGTNFAIKPLYHIYDFQNNRRLVEVNNGSRSAVVELPSQALVNQGVFEVELVNKGHFVTLSSFSRKQFKQLTGWLSGSMPIAYELKTLGWQPEGFFAFSNYVWHNGELVEYDEMGMIKVDDKHYMSLGNSKVHRDERTTENPYENDLYLKFVQPKGDINFSVWAKLFAKSFGENAAYGIAFAFLTIFKDIVTRIAKMPMLYCYGPKGSGKSAMGESLTYLFFSGKDGEGNLIRGFNLNPGQGTHFSFFNRVERFRNCPILFNEFDENIIEPWKFGTFKAAYDGEGREVGDGTTGKKKKTYIQKVHGSIVLIGQYLSIKDDGSVLSRSIACPFSLERLSNLTADELQAYDELKKLETSGLSAILVELLKLRESVQKQFGTTFQQVQSRMINDTRENGHRVEARLISNYSLVAAAMKFMGELGIELPFTWEQVYSQVYEKVIAHNRLLKDSNAVSQFWKAVEFLFDTGVIQNGRDLTVGTHKYISLKEEGEVEKREFTLSKELVKIRLSNVYSLYAKYHRERTGQPAQSEQTILMYLKEQPYYVGLTPYETFSDKRTSAYVFDYEAIKQMGIVLEKHAKDSDNTPPPESPIQPSPTPDDLPF